jgi:hypothetical protein
MSDNAPAAQEAAAEGIQPPLAQTTSVPAHFKMIFIWVAIITLITFAVFVATGIFIKKPTEEAKNVSAICGTICQMGFGAIFGLLGSRSTQ